MVVVGFAYKSFAIVQHNPYLATHRPGQLEQSQGAGYAAWPASDNHSRLTIA